jgi:hypothetical protein
MADACRGSRASDGCLTYHLDTPPVDEHFVGAGLLARGSLLLSGLPEAKVASVTLVGQRLAAYSCGGSAGITPASLLAPGQAGPGEPRRAHLSAMRRARQVRAGRSDDRWHGAARRLGSERTAPPVSSRRVDCTTSGSRPMARTFSSAANFPMRARSPGIESRRPARGFSQALHSSTRNFATASLRALTGRGE